MTSLTVREGAVIAAARELLAHVREVHGEITYNDEREIDGTAVPGYFSPSGVMVESRYIANLALCLMVLPEPIGAEEVLAAFRDERDAIRAFFSDIEPGSQEALLLAWDQARERYAHLLAEYAEGIGLFVRKAEKALGAHLAAAEQAAR